MTAVGSCSDLGSFCQFEGILHINPKVAHRAVNFCVTEQNLDCSEIARRLVDDRRFGSPERVSAVVVRLETDAADSFVD